MTRTRPSARRSQKIAPLPEKIAPMLALADVMPADQQNWAFEYKWDGIRAMTYWDGKSLTMRSRNQIVITQRFPELANLGDAIAKRGTILDGEIVALENGHPSFAQLQQRMHVDHPSPALVRKTPVWYMLFDILYVGGKSIMDLPYTDRRAQLENVLEVDQHWQLSPWSIGEGDAMLQATRQNGMEGVVAKELDSSYVPGLRSSVWRKIKVVLGQELVIGGWIPQEGQNPNASRIGALLMGYYDQRGAFRYAGRVGTGFSDKTHAMVLAKLTQQVTDKNPFIDPFPRAGVIFVKPKLVAELEYRRWPAGGLIQQAAFKGLRTDKSAREVVRESKV